MLVLTPIRIFFLLSGVVCVSFSILFILTRPRQSGHVLLAAFFADFGGLYLLLGLWDSFAQQRLLSHFLSFVLGLALAPIGLALLTKLLGEAENLRRRLTYCISGTLVVGIACSLLYFFGIGEAFALATIRAWVFGCLAATLCIELHRLRPLDGLPRQLSHFLLFFGMSCLMLLALIAFQLLGLGDAHLLVWMLMALLFFIAAGIVFRHPDTFSLLADQSKAARYSKSRLGNVDIAAKLAEVDRLMREQEVFRDMELCLEGLAERVRLKPAQLSELLNIHRKRSFSEYVLGFRIEEAKRALTAPEQDSVLDIAFACGFGSKSNFNDAFRKATGLTPSSYRKSGIDKS